MRIYLAGDPLPLFLGVYMSNKKSRLLPDDERFRLLGGPYTPPAVRRGDWLFDELRGLVEVGGYTSGRIPWPHTKKAGRGAIILCAELVRAIRTESALAVKYWWGVSDKLVAFWRKAFGITRPTDAEGTKRLYQLYQPAKLPEEVAERGREQARTPESLEKSAASKRGRPAHINTRANLLKGQGPKSDAWKARHSEAMRRQWADGTRQGHHVSRRPRVWTPEKEEQLRGLLDQGLTAREIAEAMDMTQQAIKEHTRAMRKRCQG